MGSREERGENWRSAGEETTIIIRTSVACRIDTKRVRVVVASLFFFPPSLLRKPRDGMINTLASSGSLDAHTHRQYIRKTVEFTTLH